MAKHIKTQTYTVSFFPQDFSYRLFSLSKSNAFFSTCQQTQWKINYCVSLFISMELDGRQFFCILNTIFFYKIIIRISCFYFFSATKRKSKIKSLILTWFRSGCRAYSQSTSKYGVNEVEGKKNKNDKWYRRMSEWANERMMYFNI